MERLADFTTGTPVVPVNRTRQLTLNEVMGPGGPLEALVNNTKWGGHSMPMRPYGDFTADPSGLSGTMFSEITKEGETEVWQIINMTGDAHPIHLHLVQFQLLNRQNYNVNRYTKLYDRAFQAAGFPAGFQGGWGPPLDYNTGNDPSGRNWTPFIGGNPDVTPYLQGQPRAAPPNERGWKDTFIMYPGEVTTVIARWAPTDATSAGKNYFEFDPSAGPGYVWHCHIIDHEDNEMMRPYAVEANGPGGRMDAPLFAGYLNVHPFAGPFAKSDGSFTGESLPAGFSMDQNYPNPFNPATEISFALPNAADVKLEIYNIMGQKVAILIDERREAGDHTISWDGSNVASGVYLYRLTAGEDFVETKKMILLK
jgi:hypothetical protein